MRLPRLPFLRKSLGGSRISRVGDPLPFQPPHNYGLYCDDIQRHVEPLLGPLKLVFHEKISDRVHIDVLPYPPTETRNFWTLVTSGMSDLPMNASSSSNSEKSARAELVISLPPDWGGPGFSFERVDCVLNDQTAWPLLLIKRLARFPHQFDTWLGFGHTIPNLNPPWPFGEVPGMSGALIDYPMTWPPDFPLMTASDGEKILFMGVYPLYDEEMAFTLDHGPKHMIERMFQSNITEMLEIRRPNLGLYSS